MDNSINSSYVGVPHRANYQQEVIKAKQKVKENTTDMIVGGTIGTATFGAMRNSSKVGNSIINLVKQSKALKAANKAKIIKIFEKGKFLNNPVVKKVAGPLAAFAALSTVVGSAAKIADTCQYLQGQSTDA